MKVLARLASYEVQVPGVSPWLVNGSIHVYVVIFLCKYLYPHFPFYKDSGYIGLRAHATLV